MLKDTINSIKEMKEMYQATSRVSKAAGIILVGTIGLATTLSTMYKAGLYPIHTGLDALAKDNLKNFYKKSYERLPF